MMLCTVEPPFILTGAIDRSISSSSQSDSSSTPRGHWSTWEIIFPFPFFTGFFVALLDPPLRRVLETPIELLEEVPARHQRHKLVDVNLFDGYLFSP